MGKGLIAFLAAISAATWMYTKFMNKTGGNTQSSLIAVGVLGLFVFLIVFLLAGLVPGL